MGRVKTSIVNPGNHPVNSLIMMAAPDTPPGAMLKGARKRSKLTASIIEPMVSNK
jgi:hypothetical protein